MADDKGFSFDEEAREIDKHPVINELAARFAAGVKRHVVLSSDDILVDFGCGTGLIAMHIQPFVEHMWMVDTSRGMLEVLREKVEARGIANMRICRGDVLELELPVAGFDLAYTNMTLHHVVNIRAVLNRLISLLKPGGHLCVGDLEPEDGSFHGDVPHAHQGFKIDEMRRIVENAGCRVTFADRYHIVQKPDRQGDLHTGQSH